MHHLAPLIFERGNLEADNLRIKRYKTYHFAQLLHMLYLLYFTLLCRTVEESSAYRNLYPYSPRLVPLSITP